MKIKKSILIKSVLLFNFIGTILFAQNVNLSGHVYSEATGEPLPGANIILKGTFLGAASDQTGFYHIANIPAGRYQVEVMMMGFQSVSQEVRLEPEQKATLDFRLSQKILNSPEIVVTGARRAMRKIDSPVSISTMTDDQLVLRNPATLEDVLPLEAGIQILDGQINIRGSSGYARGAGSRVAVLVDGAPAISFDNGSIYWEALPVDNLERIEILKGPGSALYGSSAMGGVVNIITRPIPNESRTQITLGGGLYSKPDDERKIYTDAPLGSANIRLSHSRRIGALGVQFGFRQNNSSGYYQNGWYRRSILDGKMEYSTQSQSNLTTRFYYIDDVHGSFTQWKNPSQPFHTPENTRHDRIFSDKLQWSTTYRRIFSPKTSMTARLNYFYTAFQNDLYNNDTYSRSHTVSGEWQMDVRPTASQYLTGGLEVKLNRVLANLWGSHNGYDAAGYLQDEIAVFPRMNVTGGLRWDVHRVDDLTTESQVNPKLGLMFKAGRNLALRMSLGWAFRAPVIAEMFIDSRQFVFEVKPNPDLKSEKSLAQEIGLYWQNDRCELDVAIFSAQYRRLIEPVVDPEDYLIHFMNVTRARISGTEISFDWIMPGLPIHNRIGYSYIDPRNLTENTTLAYRFNHSLVINEEIMLSKEISAGLDYRYLSKMKVVQLFQENPVTGADQRVPIHLVGGFVRIKPTTGLTFNLSVENLFQYYYVVIERNMGAVRNVKLQVDYRF
ncbi:MAG: TonB-dependent receptor [Candidatus Neomarinimicrobiota bacterium]